MENNCLDRSDEDPFQDAANNGTNKETIIDFGSLKNCTTISGRPGLECGGQGRKNACIEMYLWCSSFYISECPVLGEGIRTNDPTLCANNNFWRKQSCGEDPQNHDTTVFLIRCQAGNSGQCVRPQNWGYDVSNYEKQESCSDGSDLYRPIQKPTETELPDRQATQADSNEHDSDDGVVWFPDWLPDWLPDWFSSGSGNLTNDGEERINNDLVCYGLGGDRCQFPFKWYGKTFSNCTTFLPRWGDNGAAWCATRVWGKDRQAVETEDCSAPCDHYSQSEHVWNTPSETEGKLFGEELWPKYVKDSRTGLWMVAVSEESCKFSKGFVCKVKGVDTCFQNINRCDQHPVCDPGEGTGDIAQDEFGCFEEYKEKGLTPKDATHQCQSVHHNKASMEAGLSSGIVMIEAVLCDGIPTCWKRPDQTLAPDERFCDNDWFTTWIPVILLVVVIVITVGLLFAFARVFWRPRSTANDLVAANDKILRDLVEGLDQEVKEAIADPRIKISVIQLQYLGLTREERRRRNRQFFLNLADSQAESAITMKRRITKETCMQILEDYMHRPSCMSNLKEAKEDLVTIPHISPQPHNRRWCIFFQPVYFFPPKTQ